MSIDEFYNIQGKDYPPTQKPTNKTALSHSFKLSYDKALKQLDTSVRYQVCPILSPIWHLLRET